MKENNNPYKGIKKILLIIWVVCICYIAFTSFTLDRASLEWRIDFFPKNVPLIIRCDLTKQFIVLPIWAFISGLFLNGIIKNDKSLSLGLRILLGCVGIILIMIGVNYCFSGFFINIPKMWLSYILWNDLLLATIWWNVAGISIGKSIFN